MSAPERRRASPTPRRSRATSLALAAGLSGAGICGVGGWAPSPAPAAEPTAAPATSPLLSDEWQFQATPYLWALSLDGDVTVKGVKSSPHVSFSDIMQDLDGAIMLEAEARKGRLGFYANLIYADLGTTDKADGLRLKADAQTLWAGAGAFWRFGPWKVYPGEVTAPEPVSGDKAAPRTQALPGEVPVPRIEVALDPYAGFRYTYLDTELRIRNGGPQGEADKQWVDPVIGLRTIWRVGEDWSVTMLGDVGGFGAGSDLTWQAAGLVGRRFGLFREGDARVLAGYRALYQDYESGGGRHKFEWDMTLYGPTLALAIDL